jgi:hypothetical protein
VEIFDQKVLDFGAYLGFVEARVADIKIALGKQRQSGGGNGTNQKQRDK